MPSYNMGRGRFLARSYALNAKAVRHVWRSESETAVGES